MHLGLVLSLVLVFKSKSSSVHPHTGGPAIAVRSCGVTIELIIIIILPLSYLSHIVISQLKRE